MSGNERLINHLGIIRILQTTTSDKPFGGPFHHAKHMPNRRTFIIGYLFKTHVFTTINYIHKLRRMSSSRSHSFLTHSKILRRNTFPVGSRVVIFSFKYPSHSNAQRPCLMCRSTAPTSFWMTACPQRWGWRWIGNRMNTQDH